MTLDDMNGIREPAVAGTFYPNDPVALSSMIDTYLESDESSAINSAASAINQPSQWPKAIIAPHAGYIYSGLTAGKVYQRVAAGHDDIRRVVLLGPSHRVGFRGMALPTDTVFRTPLGDIPLDVATMEQLAKLPAVGYLDQAHVQEHSLEVHLPFLQQVLDDFTLVPIVVGDVNKEAVASLLSSVWDNDETLIVISSDLSHFHDYNEARTLDDATSRKITSLDANLSGEEACGCRPVNGLLHLLREKGLKLETIDVRNSGDTAGDRNRVVGYGAWQVLSSTPGEADTGKGEWSLAERQTLLQLARDAIRSPLSGEQNFNLNLQLFTDHLKEKRACFVTLNRHGRLRGCIGSLSAHRPLVVDVAHNAQAAAFKDPRFPRLTLEEFHDTELHISILTEPQPLAVESREDLLKKLRPGIDGLIIMENGRQATYLPSVWEQLPTPAQFVTELRRKAGLPGDGWDSSTRVMTYQTEEFS